jgi:hypothetical protein
MRVPSTALTQNRSRSAASKPLTSHRWGARQGHRTRDGKLSATARRQLVRRDDSPGYLGHAPDDCGTAAFLFIGRQMQKDENARVRQVAAYTG